MIVFTYFYFLWLMLELNSCEISSRASGSLWKGLGALRNQWSHWQHITPSCNLLCAVFAHQSSQTRLWEHSHILQGCYQPRTQNATSLVPCFPSPTLIFWSGWWPLSIFFPTYPTNSLICWCGVSHWLICGH